MNQIPLWVLSEGLYTLLLPLSCAWEALHWSSTHGEQLQKPGMHTGLYPEGFSPVAFCTSYQDRNQQCAGERRQHIARSINKQASLVFPDWLWKHGRRHTCGQSSLIVMHNAVWKICFSNEWHNLKSLWCTWALHIGWSVPRHKAFLIGLWLG